ncbi:hypothetical protein [Acidovorax sp. 16-64-162]|uniref:hypothetical protein n=1 Tax=Acidovorax sp. 16-64-162 TaxID=1970307 RepID=UPI0025BDE503|nr:hypothetical protein [Acidovorax sp. 16-64-162]
MTEGLMQREEFMLNVDWTEVVALFNVDSRYACSVVVAPANCRRVDVLQACAPLR